MSMAITRTQNTMGVRRLSGYAIHSVWRGPAEPGPRAANHPVTMGAVAANDLVQNSQYYFGRPASEIRHVYTPAAASIPSSSSQPSQAPTAAVVSSYTDLNAQIAPSVAHTVAPASNPTSVATMASSSQPGYVVVQSGATSSPDYVSEIMQWLESTSLLATISPSLAVPNWIPSLAVALLFTSMMSGKKR